MLAWSDVITKMQGITVDRDNLVNLLELYSSPNAFLELTSATQETICEKCEITGWNEALCSEIKSIVSVISITSSIGVDGPPKLLLL